MRKLKGFSVCFFFVLATVFLFGQEIPAGEEQAAAVEVVEQQTDVEAATVEDSVAVTDDFVSTEDFSTDEIPDVEEVITEENESASEDDVSVVTDENTADNEIVPENETSLTENINEDESAEEASSVEEETVPVEEEASSVEEETAPVEEETAPVEEEAVPVEEKAHAEEEAAPVEEETAPVEEEPAPVEEEAAPVEEETPAEEIAFTPADDQDIWAALYLSNHNAMGSMFQHESANFGFGISGEYKIPFEKFNINLPFVLGASARIEFEFPYVKNPAVEKWTIMNFTVGAWTDFRLNSFISIRPQIEFGTYMNFVKAPVRNVSGVYADFAMQIAGGFRFDVPFLAKYDLQLEAAPVFMMAFEKENVPVYLGFRVGAVYGISLERGIFNRKIKAAEKEAARLEAERVAAEEETARLEAERVAAEEEAARLEAERVAAEEETARLEAERLAAEEEARLEAERVAAEKEAARLEAERLAAEEAARLEAERLAQEEADRLAAEEAARLEAERLAQEEADRLAAEEAARLEAERLVAEEEAARLEAERLVAEEEAARLEAERLAAEEERNKKPVVAKTVQVYENADGTYSIDIPTLAFMSNSNELTSNATNMETIRKVFEVLSDEDYIDLICVVTGYVNPDYEEWTEEEKQLALGRAQAVVNELVKLGIDESRFTAKHGSGKTENKEFNRRVEFRLSK